MIFDTHAHYDDDAFDEDRDTLLGEIFSSGICCITDVGASVKSSKSAVALSKKWPQIYAAVGVHPDSTADSFYLLPISLITATDPSLPFVFRLHYSTSPPAFQKMKNAPVTSALSFTIQFPPSFR